MASSISNGLGWERFEELTKAAVAANPHGGGTRFFLKTRVQRGRGVQIVSRVTSGDRGLSATYRTPLPSHLGRLTRLLRFVMQEMLGSTLSGRDSSASPVATTPASVPGVTPTTTTPPTPTPSASKPTPSKKKKKNVKKK